MAKKKRTKKKTGRARPQPTAERRIMFYRIDCGRDDAGTPIAYAPGPALNHINGLPWTNTGRYQPASDGDVVCSWVDRSQANQQMRFATVRRASLPLVENGSGTLSPLNIAANAGLSEITHLVFFPNNILGAVFNFYGPRPTRLAAYLKARVPNTPLDLTINPLIRTDITEELDRFETLRVVNLKIRPSYTETIAQADESLGQSFAAAQSAVTDQAEEVALSLSAGRKKRAHLGDSLMGFVRRMVGRDDLHENAMQFTMSGLDTETQRSATLDLLSDKLVSTKRIIKQSQRSRALDTESAYAAVQEAYNELHDQLQAAAAAELE